MIRGENIGVLAVAVVVGGCTLFFDEVNQSECTEDFHCPVEETCQFSTGRCVPRQAPEASMPELGMPDERIVPVRSEASAPEGGLDEGLLEADVPDTGGVDADVGLGAVGPPYPGGECFPHGADPDKGQLQDYQAPFGSTHVPWGFCTAHGVAWTSIDDGEARVHVLRGPGADEVFYPYHRGSAPLMSGSNLMFLRENAAHGGTLNIYRVDLEARTEGWWRPGSSAQQIPARGDGFYAFVEDGIGRETQVILRNDSGRYVECGVAGRVQWGVAAQGTTVAWLERIHGARRARIVVIRDVDATALDCGERRARLRSGVLDDEARVHLTNDHVVWIERDSITHTRALWAWEHLAPDERLDRVSSLTPGTPIELAAAGDVAAVIRYWRNPPAPSFSLELMNLADRSRSRTLSRQRGDARNPVLTQRFVIWAEYSDDPAWEVRYERLQ